MGTFLIVLAIVGTMIVLATRLSFYLYKSGALGNSHTRHPRRLYPAAVGVVSKRISPIDAIDLVQKRERKTRRARIGLLLAVFVLAIALFAIVMFSMIGTAFS